MNSLSHRRLLLKTALALQLQYEGRDLLPPPITLPREQLDRLQRLHRQCRLARQHDYIHALQRCRRDLSNTLQLLQHPLNSLRTELDQSRSQTARPTFRLLYEELDSLFVEFETVEISLKSSTLTVITEPITLEQVDLGQFEIVFNWSRLDQDSPYDVRAVQSVSAASNSTVTHPHVQSQHLCEGDGRPAIMRALNEGRIGEFFVLVRQVLRTYNEQSAYVSLDAWHGVTCSECADTMGEDDASTCDRCDCSLCSDCARCCNECDVSLCFACSSECASCEDRFCRHCLIRCSDCHERCCGDCLEDGRCPNCLEPELDEDDAQPQDPSLGTPTPASTPPETLPSTAHVEVQPHRVGQAALST